jgi:hypothetical protein
MFDNTLLDTSMFNAPLFQEFHEDGQFAAASFGDFEAFGAESFGGSFGESFGGACTALDSFGAAEGSEGSLSALLFEAPKPRRQSSDIRSENLTTLARASLELQAQKEANVYSPVEPFLVLSNHKDFQHLVSKIKGGRFARKGDGSGGSRGGNNRTLPEKIQFLKLEMEEAAKKGISFDQVQAAIRECKTRWFTRVSS